jgi:hypothetical protein
MDLSLRLGLIFFDDADTRLLRSMIEQMASPIAPWVVVDGPPLHAVLLARGPRLSDPPHLALLRLAADAERYARRQFGDSMPPMALPKPLRREQLKLVLEMAAASLIPEQVERILPQTEPRAPLSITLPRPATLP